MIIPYILLLYHMVQWDYIVETIISWNQCSSGGCGGGVRFIAILVFLLNSHILTEWLSFIFYFVLYTPHFYYFEIPLSDFRK